MLNEFKNGLGQETSRFLDIKKDLVPLGIKSHPKKQVVTKKPDNTVVTTTNTNKSTGEKTTVKQTYKDR